MSEESLRPKVVAFAMLVLTLGLVHVAVSTWSTPWEHAMVGLETLAFFAIAFGTIHRWGFR